MNNGGSLGGYKGAQVLPADELLYLDCDLLIPAALGGVITKDNVDKIKARSIIEGANGPIYPEADAILAERGVTVLPDILATLVA